MDLLKASIPRIPKRHLYFVAAWVWTFAGGMLLFRGMHLFEASGYNYWSLLAASLVGGLVFYRVLFSGISRKHVARILALPDERPCLFSFFNLRSYLLMGLMIAAGISLRKSGILPARVLAVTYVTMGLPLFLSSFRFYHAGIQFKNKQ